MTARSIPKKADGMDEKKRRRKMDISLIVLAGVVLSFMAVAFHTGGFAAIAQGLGKGWNLLASVGVRLLLGFALAGLMQVVIPPQYVLKWIGHESGYAGVWIGSLAGSLMPGGPYVMFPIIGGLYQAGASVGPLMAFVTSWSVMSFNRLLVWEIPMLGAKVALVRFAASMLFPPIVGFFCNLAFHRSMR
jgi:hypothetical protein